MNIKELHNQQKDLTNKIQSFVDRLNIDNNSFNICYQDHYENVSFSIYTVTGEPYKIKEVQGIRFFVEENLKVDLEELASKLNEG